MRLFKRRCSDPNPQLVSLSPLPDPGSFINLSNTSLDCPISPKEDQGYGKLCGQKWDQKKRDSSELLSVSSGRRRHWSPLNTDFCQDPGSNSGNGKRISRVDSLRSMFSRNDRHSDGNPSLILNSELLPSELRRIYDVYKEANKKDEEKSARGKHRLKSVVNNLELSEQQFLDYLLLMKPTTQQEFQSLISELGSSDKKAAPNKMEVLAEGNIPRKSRKFRGVRNLFSRLSSKSDNESDSESPRAKRSISSGSLTSLSELLMSSKKTLSLSEISYALAPKSKIIKSDESGYSSDSTALDSPRGSIKSQTSNMSTDCPSISSEANHTLTTESYFDKTLQDNDSLQPIESVKKSENQKPKSQHRSKIRLSVRKRNRSESTEAKLSFSKKRNVLEKDKNRKSGEFKKFSFSGSSKKRSVEDDRKYKSEELKKISIETFATANDLNEDRACKSEGFKKVSIEDLSKEFSEKLDKLSLKFHSTVAYPSATLQSYKKNPTHSLIDKDFKCVRLKVKDNETIGLTIAPKDAGPSSPYVIMDILPGSIAEQNGNFWIGDEIVKINGTRLRGLNFTLAISLLTPINGKLEMVISRFTVLKTEEKMIDHPERRFFNLCRSPAIPKTDSTNATKTDYLFDQNDAQESPLKFNAFKPSNQLPNITSPVSLKSLDTINIVGDKEKQVTGMRKFSYQSEGSNPRWSGPFSSPARVGFRRFTTTFRKGPGMKALGFSVVGGKDSPRGPMGMYIKTIFKQGQAADEGSIQEGDKIISINGILFDGLAHSQAISLFKNIKCGDVQLCIERKENPSRSLEPSSTNLAFN